MPVNLALPLLQLGLQMWVHFILAFLRRIVVIEALRMTIAVSLGTFFVLFTVFCSIVAFL
jgi:hypothetical protein